MIRAVVHFNRTNVRIRVRVEGAMSLTPLSAILQFYRGCQFYWWRKPECPQKTIAQSLTNFSGDRQ